MKLKRREFLTSSLGAGFALLAPGLSGCDDESGAPNAPPEVDFDDMRAVLKGPFVQLMGSGRARLRFETRTDEATPVRVTRAGESAYVEAQRNATDLDYFRPVIGDDVLRDERGDHVLHDVYFEDLDPGEVVAYTIEQWTGPPIEGSFVAPVTSGSAFRLGWISDTMLPFAPDSIRTLAEHAPDLVLHGGDITYDASPFDSWNQIFHELQPLLRNAAAMFVVGNHEFESQEELDVQYRRLFTEQGDSGSQTNYFAFTYGGVRFICIDSESSPGKITEEGSPQLAWLDGELEAAADDSSVREIVLAFHRPTYTLSKHAPGDTAMRDVIHERCLEYGVRLVLCGHVHAYERFEVDGVTYVIDGGGGALGYDPDEELEWVESQRPGESELRVTRDESGGVCVLDFLDDGSVDVVRYKALKPNRDGSLPEPVVTDSFTLPARV